MTIVDTRMAATVNGTAPDAPAAPYPWRGLAVLTAAALGIRLATLVTTARRNPAGGDPLYYHVQANLLAAGRGFAEPFTWLRSGRIVPTAVHPPLWSLVLSLSSLFGGISILDHKIVACVVGTAAVLAIGALATEVAGARVGLVAAGLAAVYPNLWVVDGTLMPEGLTALTVALVLWSAVRLIRSPTGARALTAGALVGLASLARGENVLLVAVCSLPAAIVPLWRAGLVRAALRRGATVAVAGALVLAPWLVRNAVTFDRPVAVSTNSDEVLANSNCDLTWSGPLLGFWEMACYRGRPAGDESERAAYWRGEGLSYVDHHLSRLPVVLAARVGRVWSVYRPIQDVDLSTIEGRNRGAALAGLIMYVALLPLAALGLLALRRERRVWWPLMAPVALVTLTAMYAYGVTRFRMPAEVSLVVLAAAGVQHLAAKRAAA